MGLIPPPPPSSLSDAWAYGLVGGCLIVGGAMVLWGRQLHRAILCLVGVAVGLALAGPLAQRMGWNLMIVRLAAMVCLVLAGLILARLIWALLLAGLISGLACWGLLARVWGQITPENQPTFHAAENTFACWIAGLGPFCHGVLMALWRWNMPWTIGLLLPSMFLPLALGLLWPRLTRIVMTALLGAAGVVTAVAMAMGQWRPELWESLWRWWMLPVGLILAGAVAGIVIQYRKALAADAAQRKAEAETQQQNAPVPKAKGKT